MADGDEKVVGSRVFECDEVELVAIEASAVVSYELFHRRRARAK